MLLHSSKSRKRSRAPLSIPLPLSVLMSQHTCSSLLPSLFRQWCTCHWRHFCSAAPGCSLWDTGRGSSLCEQSRKTVHQHCRRRHFTLGSSYGQGYWKKSTEGSSPCCALTQGPAASAGSSCWPSPLPGSWHKDMVPKGCKIWNSTQLPEE